MSVADVYSMSPSCRCVKETHALWRCCLCVLRKRFKAFTGSRAGVEGQLRTTAWLWWDDPRVPLWGERSAAPSLGCELCSGLGSLGTQ